MHVLDNFLSLDGLIQGDFRSPCYSISDDLTFHHSKVLYHSTSCFVLLSNVETAAWVVELGLVDGGNRWWRGSWSEKDVLKLVVCRSR